MLVSIVEGRRDLCYSSNGYWVDGPIAIRGTNRNWADMEEFQIAKIGGAEYLIEIDHRQKFVQLTKFF